MLGISIDSGNYETLTNQINSASKIVGGRNFFAALTADGKVYGWGNNGYGQLAQGDTANRLEPVYMNIDNVVDIAAGYFYTVAVKADGTVWTVGYNADGELGCGDATVRYEFVQVKNPDGDEFLRNVKSVSVAYATTYAITYDGEVYAWGYNNYAQMGSKETASKLLPYKTELTNIKEIAGGEGFALALSNDGTVWTIGRNTEGQLGIANSTNTNTWQKMKDTDGVTDLTNVKQVSGGKHHTVILKNDGTVYSTGYNYYGELADGKTESKNIIAPMTKSDESQMTNVKSICATAYSSWILTNDGEIYGTGYNGYSQLATGDVTNQTRLMKAKTYGKKVDKITATPVDGYDTLAYVDDIGRIYTSGYNANGELGNGSTQNTLAPKYMASTISDYRLVANEPIINIRKGQSRSVSATISLNGINLIDKNFSVNYTLKSLDTNVVTVSGNTITAVGLGTTYVRISDEVNNIHGSIKVNVNEIDGETYPKISGGQNHFIALKSDGTAYTWGYNNYGQIGNGTVVSQLKPQKVEEFIHNGEEVTKAEMKNIIDVAAGYSFTLILKKDGTVWSAGYNGYGQLGDGQTANRSEFQKVKLNENGEYLENIVAIAAGANTSYAISTDGTVWSWGINSNGQFGVGNTTTLYYPTKMKNVPSIMQISAGESHIAMLAADGTVWSAGYNGYGQFGIGSTATTVSIPQQMFNTEGTDILKGIKEVSTGIYSTQILTESGEAYGIGYNNCGQLSVGDANVRYVPTKMIDGQTDANITGLNHIHSSAYLTFATKNDNGLYVVGYANQNQNFTEDTTAINKFKKVLDDKKVIAMAVTTNTEYQTGAIVDSEGKIWTVGYNAEGEIGNETTETPIKTPICITNSRIKSDKIIDLEVPGNTKQINYSRDIGFNLLTSSFLKTSIEFKSLDENIATVNSSGLVTAKNIGTTYIRIIDKLNNIYGSVKVNVNGKGNVTQAKIDGGANHFIALKGDGTVWVWGLNNNGQLGTGDTTNRKEPVQPLMEDENGNNVPITDAIDVVAGYNNTFILRKDGTVLGAGYNGYGGLANGTSINQVIFHKLQLEKANPEDEPRYIQNAIQIAADDSTIHILTEDGDVYSAGYNYYGNLGIGKGTGYGVNPYLLKTVKVHNIMQISAGEIHLSMLSADGSVWNVGYNETGALGLGNTANQSYAQQMKTADGKDILYGVKEVSAGRHNTYILKEDGTVWSTGYNNLGQLGIGATGNITLIQQVRDVADVEGVSTAHYIQDAKHINAKGHVVYISSQDKGMYTIGQNTNGALFTKDQINRMVATKVETNKEIFSMSGTRNTDGNTAGAIVDKDGKIYMVGCGVNGEIGNNTVENIILPYCISNLELHVKNNLIHFQNAGETQKLQYSNIMGMNLLKNDIQPNNCEFISMDENVATVNSNGVVTAKGIGYCIVKVHDTENDLWGVARVFVDGTGNIAQPKIEGGANHYVALKGNGTVWTWGLNNSGQLGLGDYTNRVEPEQALMEEDGNKIPITDAIDIAAGYNFSMILRKDGTVWTTGHNNNGQLGDGTGTNNNLFHKVKLQKINETDEQKYLENIVQISAGDETSYALTKDGKVYGWGYNGHGQLGTGDGTGSVYPQQMLKVSNIAQISAGEIHIAMLATDGSVWNVGYNGHGQFSLENQTSYSYPQQMKTADGKDILYGVKEVSAGRHNNFVVKEDNTVWSAGYNHVGQLGIGNTTASSLIQQVRDIAQVDGVSNAHYIEDAKHVTARGHVTYISTRNNGMYVMGENPQGGLFTQEQVNKIVATKVETDKDILTMSPTRNNGSAITGAIADQDGMVYTVGFNGNGEMGNGTVENLITPWCISKKKINVEKNVINFAEIGQKEKIKYNTTLEFNLLRDTVPGESCTFETMNENIATVTEDGTVTAKGQGSTTIKLYNAKNDLYASIKVNVNGTGNVTAPKIVGGANHFVALKANGTVWAWGYNAQGQLGLGDTTNRVEPEQMKATIILEDGTTKEELITDAIDIATGYNFTLVLRKDGTVWVTGYNGYGQVGNGNTANVATLTQVKGEKGEGYLSNIVQLAGSGNTSYALSAKGEVYSWGINYYGNFGVNYGTGYQANYYPIKMQKVSNIIQITAGDSHISMLDANGSVWSTGYNGNGQFGVGNMADRSLPIQMTDTDGSILYGVKEIAAGTNTTTIIKEDNSVWAVGYNGHGEIGDGTTANKSIIVPVLKIKTQAEDGTVLEAEQIKDAKHVTAGGLATYISRQKDENKNNQGMYVLGYNYYGQIFTKDTQQRLYVEEVENDKDILAMALTRNTDGCVTGAIADQDGMVYTVGFNVNGEMGNGTVENLITPWCISKKKIKVIKDTINFTQAEQTEKIEYTTSVDFNLIRDTVPGDICKFKSMDESVAVVDENTGLVTAKGQGSTIIKLYNAQNNLYSAVRVNVNGEGNIIAPKLAGGANHLVALKADGTVWTWGCNNYGQLGVDDNENKTEPIKTNMKNAIDIVAGYNFTVVLKKDGTVWTAGYNGYGELGDGTTTNSNSFHKVKLNDNGDYLENIVQIAAEANTVHALTADGTVYSWGYNEHGQFGANYGTGRNANCYPVKMQKVSNIIQISAGENFVTMLDADGSVWNVGYNEYGQFGVGDASSRSLPIQMKDTDGNVLYGVKEVAAGTITTTILKEDNTVWSVGYNGHGEIGDGTTANKSVITPVLKIKSQAEDGTVLETEQIKDAKHITAGGYGTYISKQNGGMYVLGCNPQGSLFTQDKLNKVYATEVETDKDILAMTITKNNEAYTTGAIADQDGMVYTVGFNGNGEMGNKTVENLIVPWCISEKKINVEKNIINFEHSGETDEIKYNSTMRFNLIRENVPGDICSFKSLDENVATVDDNGIVTAQGQGTTIIKLHNEKNNLYGVVRVNVNGDGNITAPKLVGGANHFVALKANGTVWSWGYNGQGQLGLGDTTSRVEPEQMKATITLEDGTTKEELITDAIDIATGYNFTLILRKDGTVWCTGYNGYGQLGNGNTANTTTLTQVKGENGVGYLRNIVQLAGSGHTSYALSAKGEVYSWGINYHGNFGINYGTGYQANCYPIKMQKVSNIIQITAGDSHISMLDADGSVWSTGYNGNGQFGVGDTSSRSLPIQMKDIDGSVLYGVKEIATGTNTTTIIKEDGSVWAVGYNGHGEIGDGTTTNRNIIVPVVKETQEDGTVITEQIKDAKHVSASGYTTYISRPKDENGNNQGMYVLGYNYYGQLFTQDTQQKLYATEVEKDKDLITMTSTRNTDGYVTGAIADQDGKVYTVGFNGNGEMGNGTVENLIVPWCISKLRVETNPKIINYKNIGENSEKISQNITMGFNLIKDEIEGGTFTYSSVDEKIATVDDNGVVTAQGIGTTFVKVYNKENNIWGAVRVNVNGSQGQVQPKIVGGANHFVALRANGTVWGWGYNGQGQLGLGDTTNRVEPEQMKAIIILEDGTTKEELITDAIDVATGYNFTLVLRKDGTVWCTGYNGYGQLGNGNTVNTTTLTQVKGEKGEGYLENIVQLAGSGHTSYALSAKGEVYSWGINYYGNFGINYGTGYNANCYPIKMQKVSNIIQITAGDSHVSMLDADGSIWSTGYNGYGQFGVGDAGNRSLPIQVKDTDGTILHGVKEIATGTHTTTILKEDGSIWAVGYNGHGEIGDGTTANKSIIVPVVEVKETKEDGTIITEQIKDAKHISASGYTTYISRQKDEENNQGMYVLGYNYYGQLFTVDTVNKVYATKVQIDKDLLTMTSTRNTDGYITGAIADINGMVYTVGYNGNGEMGNGTVETTYEPVCISKVKLEVEPSIINYKNVGDTGEKISCYVSAGFNLLYETLEQGEYEFTSLDEDVATVDNKGVVTAAGEGETYIRVYNKKNDCYGAVKIRVNGRQGKTYPKIVGGANHFAALRANGEIWTWGYNGYGNLGLGDNDSRNKPTKTNIYDEKDDSQTVYAIDVAAGTNHTVVLKSDGTVWCTGYNGYGNLGEGTTGNSNTFVQVKGPNGIGYLENIVEISANHHMTYALSADGSVYSWGFNYYGNFGVNYGTGYQANCYPIKMQKVSNIIQISAGEHHIVMLDADGSAWAVGYNGHGALGTGDTSGRVLPQKVKNEDGKEILTGIKKVSAGAYHTIILKEDGTALAMGYNGYGQLANGTTNNMILPTKMLDEEGNPVENIKDISAKGYISMLSIKPDNNGEAGMYVAGYNNFGQLHTKDTGTRALLTKVQTEKNIITQVGTHNVGAQTSAIADDLGVVYTVGYNGNGEMGDERWITSINPTSISDETFEVDTQRIILTLGEKETEQINAATDLGFNLLYSIVEGEKISYKSLDPSIATVDSNGLVQAQSYGTAKIEVTTNKLPNKVIVTVEVLRKGDIAKPKMVSGREHTVALKSDGTVWVWGYNGNGQLGLGDTVNRYKPTKVNIENVIDIAAGEGYTLMLTKDGKVYSCGANGYSQLGRTGDNTIPLLVDGLENIIQISASTYNAMALTKNGNLYTWGYNGNGQLGNAGTASTQIPAKIKIKGIVKIDSKNQTSTAIDGDGNLYTWGYNGYGQLGNGTTSNIYEPTRVLGLENIVDVAVEDYTILALDKDGYVYSSGYNGYGNLGNGNTNIRYTFDKVIKKIDETTQNPIYLSNIKFIEAGYINAVAVSNDGISYNIGYNGYGQNGNGNTDNNFVATEIKYGKEKDIIDNIYDVAVSEGNITIARQDGKVWTIGKDNFGQMGDSSTKNKQEFVCISNSHISFEESPIRIKGIGKTKQVVADMFAGFNLFYNTIENKEFKFESKNTKIVTVDEHTGVVTSVKKGKTTITVTDTISGEKASVDVYVLGDDDITFPQIETYDYSTVTLRANGEVWSYGNNSYGQLGTGDRNNKLLPTNTGINNIVEIAIGSLHTVALDKDGHVWTWGYNGYGQLGTGDTVDSNTKVQVKSPDGKGVLENIVSVSAGYYYSMALDKDGNVYTWGYNGYGNLGLGDGNTRVLPVKVDSLEKIRKIAASNVSSFAIDNNNDVWVAGYNGNGNLGDGTTQNRSTFVKSDLLTDVADIKPNQVNGTIALLLDGTVWGFGYNANNSLTDVGGAIPQQLHGPDGDLLSDITSIDVGYYSGYAITSEEKVLAWGLNNYTQLADGTTQNQAKPVYMKDANGNDVTDVMLVSGGIYNTELAKTDGTVWSVRI